MLHECDPEARIDRASARRAPLRSRSRRGVRGAGGTAVARGRRPAPGGGRPPRTIGRRPRPPSTSLVRAGEAAMGVVDDGLSSDELDRRVQELFVRVARDVGGPAAIAVLRDHIEHRDPDVGLAVMRALAAIEPADIAAAAAPDPRELEVVPRDVEHAAHVLRALVAFEDEPSLVPAARGVARRARPAVPAGHRGALDAARHRGPRPCRLPARPARRALPRARDRVAGRDPHRSGARGGRPPRAEPLAAGAPAPAQPLLPARVR